MTFATVKLWNQRVGVAQWDPGRNMGAFQFDPDFFTHQWDVAPLTMPFGDTRPHEFPELNARTFRRLPGMLADSLPDKYGDEVLAAWLASQNRQVSSMNPVERLCYIGKRGMGALEFEPETAQRDLHLDASAPVDVARLGQLASDVLSRKTTFAGRLDASVPDPMTPLLQVSTSPGGGLPKAIIAWNEKTNEVRSGQVDAGPGFGYWILKFGHIDRSGRPVKPGAGDARTEYAYCLMALDAGISMSRCRLFEENGRAHFMTERFDRRHGEKIHAQTLCAMAHMDFNDTAGNSYEKAFAVLRGLGFSAPQKEEFFRRMAFNVLACNYDDHTKNTGFLMGKDGRWHLAPAYDLLFTHDKGLSWGNAHMSSIGGKTDGFTRADLLQAGVEGDVPMAKAKAILGQVEDAVKQWPKFAKEAGVSPDAAAEMRRVFPSLPR